MVLEFWEYCIYYQKGDLANLLTFSMGFAIVISNQYHFVIFHVEDFIVHYLNYLQVNKVPSFETPISTLAPYLDEIPRTKLLPYVWVSSNDWEIQYRGMG